MPAKQNSGSVYGGGVSWRTFAESDQQVESRFAKNSGGIHMPRQQKNYHYDPTQPNPAKIMKTETIETSKTHKKPGRFAIKPGTFCKGKHPIEVFNLDQAIRRWNAASARSNIIVG